MAESTSPPRLTVAARSKWSWLRVGLSVFFAFVTAALCVLWMRSYQFADTIYPSKALITSEQGELQMSWSGDRPQTSQWIYIRPVVVWNPSQKSFLPRPSPLFGWQYGRNRVSAHFPHWSVLMVTTGLAIIPWLKYSFSLRTLLVATTVVAVVLGLAVWAGR